MKTGAIRYRPGACRRYAFFRVVRQTSSFRRPQQKHRRQFPDNLNVSAIAKAADLVKLLPVLLEIL